MSSDKILGGTLLLGGIVGIGIYLWLLFFSPWAMLALQLSAFLAVAAILVIVAWIGYTMATVPAPIPIEDLDLGEDLKEQTQ